MAPRLPLSMLKMTQRLPLTQRSTTHQAKSLSISPITGSRSSTCTGQVSAQDSLQSLPWFWSDSSSPAAVISRDVVNARPYLDTRSSCTPYLQQPAMSAPLSTPNMVPTRDLSPALPLPSTLGQSTCLLYTSPSPRDRTRSRMPSSA